MTNFNRIISFLPSATEIIFDLGLGEYLKGVTHECIYPLKAFEKPKVISPSIDFNDLDSSEIDVRIKEMSSKNQPIFNIDSKKIIEIKPDLIISQNLCSVCAPFDREIQKTFHILGYEPKNLVINPTTISGILDSIILIGKVVGNLEVALKRIRSLNHRMRIIKSVIKKNIQSGDIKRDSRILCLDWIDPMYLAGHWVPEMINIAGGHTLNEKPGFESKPIDMKEVSEYDPDKIILMPCGFDIHRTETEYKNAKDISWQLLRAVKDKEVYIVDSNSYFSKPSPRIITGIEILCKILHPEIFEELQIPNNSFIRL